MYEITITEIKNTSSVAASEATCVFQPDRIERLKQTVDDLDIVAVINAVNGRKRGPKRKAA